MIQWKGYVKGINLGGWLSQCDYSVERLEKFIAEEDIKKIAEWGFDHVRLPFDYNIVQDEEGNLIEKGFEYLQRAVTWCEKHHLNIVLDLHKTAGYSFDKDEGESGFFDSEMYQERFYSLWEEMAKRFGSYEKNVAFELLNEVTDKNSMDSWNHIASICIGRVRKFAPETKILVGGYWNNAAAAVKDIAEPIDKNIVYNFHCYEPLIFTHQGASWVEGMPLDFRMDFDNDLEEFFGNTKTYLPNNEILLEPAKNLTGKLDSRFFEALFAEAVSVAEERGVSLYCGEYGVIDLASSEDTVQWYAAIHQTFRKYGIGRAAWNYKDLNYGLVDSHMDSVREDMINIMTTD
ncbi:MAG: cellulase family glycosylhydrolase [Lachnospiraceae bacterium]|nr:cellulase family glycosylhydrolase [Lachnospiraceae bacterium]